MDLFCQRAGLAAVRFHFTGNLTGELFELSMRADLFLTLLTLLAAVLATIYWFAYGVNKPVLPEPAAPY